jgi:hypothetical protein
MYSIQEKAYLEQAVFASSQLIFSRFFPADCGSLDGGTIWDFVNRVESYSCIYAFEPDPTLKAPAGWSAGAIVMNCNPFTKAARGRALGGS